ncbi:MAG TPA: 6,7-dimethyl-8-ribityllumazine synthase [Gemmatimonadetes bacterium]|nr:6,7-dimethyl-8-ribityllumazine synthase [Gemmatimonadota bacterium]
MESRRGALDASGLRVAIITARFNKEVTNGLLRGALEALAEHGAREEDVVTFRVPGAWELPQAAAQAVEAGRFDAVVTLGCVIRGETPHFEYVCQEASRGLGVVARSALIPVVFGVLTTDTLEQAKARAGSGVQNKGYESAMAAIEMVSVMREIRAEA